MGLAEVRPRHGTGGNTPVMPWRPPGKARCLASPGMSTQYRRGEARAHDVRRLRDMIRAAVQGGRYPGGQLPAEAALMAAHGASRATVREALSLLRAEGLIERTQGIGTHAVVRPADEKLVEVHGVIRPDQHSLLNRRTRPRLLDRSEIAAPALVADRLGAPAGTPCLRLEYVALHQEEPIWLATNYALFPEAARLRDTPFVTDWYALLADAGVEFGQSEFIIGAEPADPFVAAALGIAPGAPVLVTEQTIADPAGRPFDLAFIHIRADRFRFVSRGTRLHGREA